MTIEERIVQLGLNNNNFEKHAQESMKTLDRLDSSLKSIGSAVGFDKLEGMIETVTHRFSALGIAGDQVIRTITNQVMNLVGEMGTLAKSMSIDQVTAGFSKYEDKTRAVQTIMAATAKDWEDQGAQMEWVNEQLEKLNWFSDETSYSFLDMANNIGKFTSNGVKLEESVTAMEGISTWAAISGATVSEAGRAMYNLSQALATGTVKLVDWKSIENANMATREFKDAALETAVALKTLKKNADGTYTVVKSQTDEVAKSSKKAEKAVKSFTAEQFNTELSEGWFTKEVLMETLQRYGRFTDVLNEAAKATGRTATQILNEVDAYKENGKVASWLTEYIDELASAENELGYRAFKAAQEAKTFHDAIEATKDAVSTGWMNLWEKMFGNYLEAKGFWTDMAESFYNIFAEPVNKLNEIFDVAFGGRSAVVRSSSKITILNRSLEKAGKSSKDLEKAFSKIDDMRLEALISEYGTLEEAINRGAVQGELLRKVLSELGIDVEVAEEVEEAAVDVETFEERLAKAGRSMKDFEAAFSKIDDLRLEALISEYGSLDEAIRQGAIGADLFKQILEEMAGQSSDTAEAVGADISKLAGSMEEYRDVALQVLRGDLGNGEERRKRLEEMGYDYEMIQWLAGNLKHYGYEISDEFLLSLPKTKEVQEAFEHLMINAGYTEEEVAAMNELLANSDQILEDAKNEVTVIREKFDSVKGAKLFRDGILNILHAIEDVTNAISEAFDIVFGGSEDGEKAIENFGKKLNDLIQRFHSFTQSLTMDEKRFEEFRASMVRIFTVIQKVGSAVGKVARIMTRAAKGAFSIILSVIRTVVGAVSDLYSQLLKNRAFRHFSTAFHNVAEAFRPAISIIADFISALFKVTTAVKLPKWVKSVSDAITRFSAKLAIATIRFKQFMKSEETLEKLRNALEKIAGFASTLKNTISTVFSVISNIVSNFWEKLKGPEDTEKSFFGTILGGLSKAIEWIEKGFTTIKNAIKNTFGSGEGVGLTNILNNLLKVFLGFAAVKGLGKVFGGLGDLFGGIGSIGEFLKNPTSIFRNFIENFKELFGLTEKKGSFVKDLRNIAVSIGILALSMVMLAAIPEEKIATTMGHLTTLLVELIGAIKTIDIINPGKGVSKAAAAMIAISLALVLLAASMRILAKIDPERLTGAWEAMTFSLMSMIAALFLISKIKINTGKLLAVGAAMIGIAAAMLLISAALWVLSKIDPDRLTAAWEAMTFSLLSMVIALYALGSIGAVKMIAAGAAMIMVAGAMIILSLGLALLSKVIESNEDAIRNFIITLGIMVVALALLGLIGPVVLAAGAALLLAGVGFAAGAIGLILLCKGLNALNDVKINPDTILSFGGALIALGIAGVIFGLGGLGLLIGGAGLLVLGLALNTMNSVHVKPDYLLALGGSLIALGIAGVIFGLGGLGLILGGAGLMLLGVALNMFNGVTVAPDYLLALGGALLALGVGGVVLGLGALGLIVGAAGLAALAAVLPSLAAGVREFSDIGGEALKATFFALAEAIAALFLLQFSTIINGVPVLKELAEAMPAIAAGFKSFENVDGNSIAVAGDGLSRAISALFKLQFATFADGVPVLRELAEAMPGISTGFKSFEDLNGDAIALAGVGLGKAINALFTLQFASFRDGSDMLNQLAGSLPELSTGFKAFDELDPNAIVTTGNALKNAINSLFKLQFSTIRDGTPQLMALSDALPKIAAGFNAFSGTEPNWLKKISNALDSALSTLTSGGMFTKKHDYSGLIDLGNALQQFWNGLSNFVGEGDIQSPVSMITELVNTMKSSITTSFPDFEANGGQILVYMSNGIALNSGKVAIAIAGVMNSINDTIVGYNIVWSVLGGNISVGLANGIYEKSYVAVKAASDLASSVSGTVQKALDEHSPSRVMERLGEFASIGLGQGIQNESGYVEKSMITMISPAMAVLNTLLEAGTDISPRITPVMDMSSMRGVSPDVFSAALGGYNFNRVNEVNQAVNYSLENSEMVTAVRSLSDQVGMLGERITNMEVVLDSGALVGNTSERMDAQLGKISARRKRAN